MGSSGLPEYLRAAALALRDSGHNVVIATTSILDAELEPGFEFHCATTHQNG
jgi:hypothetical protein